MQKIKQLIIELFLFILIILTNPITIGKFLSYDGTIDLLFINIVLWAWTIILFIILILIEIIPQRFELHIIQNWKKYIFLITWCIILFFIAEFIFRAYTSATIEREYDIHSYEFNYSVKLNSDLFRDEEFVKEKNENIRMFIIGDSFIFGAATAQNETIDSYLEKELNNQENSTIPKYDVWNLGRSGTGLQEYYQVANQFKNFEPNIVILSLYVDNDISLGVHLGESLNYFSIITAINEINFDSSCIQPWVYDYDVDPYYQDHACKGMINLWLLKRATFGEMHDIYNQFVNQFEKDKTTKKMILSIHSLFPKSRFIILINPSKYQITTEHNEELKKLGFVFAKDTLVDNKIQQVITQWAEEQNIEYIDILPVMKSLKKGNFYPVIDDHYTAEANELVGKEIFKYLNYSKKE